MILKISRSSQLNEFNLSHQLIHLQHFLLIHKCDLCTKRTGDAAKDVGEAAKDAARGVGDAAEDTLDGMTNAAKDTAKSAKDASK